MRRQSRVTGGVLFHPHPSRTGSPSRAARGRRGPLGATRRSRARVASRGRSGGGGAKRPGRGPRRAGRAGRGWWPDKRGIAIQVRELPGLAEALAAALDLAAEHQAPRPPSSGPRRVKPALPTSPPAGPSGRGEFSEFSES